MPPDNEKSIKVWDPFVRLFHWSLVFCFLLAYITEDDWLNIHSYAGYTVVLLVTFRIIWGLVGTHYARFSSFVTSFRNVKAYLKEIMTGNAKHYVGHNPAGGLMIILLLVSLFLTTFTGMSVFATEGYGPLASTFISQWPEDFLEEAHELFANLTVLMVIIHISGVLVSSLIHKENLIKSMVTGKKYIEVEVIKNTQENINEKS